MVGLYSFVTGRCRHSRRTDLFTGLPSPATAAHVMASGDAQPGFPRSAHQLYVRYERVVGGRVGSGC